MVTFNTRVSTTDGSRVRGLEQQIKPGVSAEDAARALLTRVGGEGALTRLKQDFDFRLISRGGEKYLQIREKTFFGALKAHFSRTDNERQTRERGDALAVLGRLNVAGRGVKQALQGPHSPMSNRSAAAALTPHSQPQPQTAQSRPSQLDNLGTAPAPSPAAARPRMADASSAAPAASVDSAAKAPPSQHKWIADAQARAVRLSSLDMARPLSTKFLLQALSDGEITFKTYETVITERLHQGRLRPDEHRMLLDHDPKLLPDQSQVSLVRQRAQHVRDEVQAKLFQDLKPKHLFGLVLSGQITERAYVKILKEQNRRGAIDDITLGRWQNVSTSADTAKKARSIDLNFQINCRRMDEHQKAIYADTPLQDLWRRREQGVINDPTFESILRSQKTRGLITSAEFEQWSWRLDEPPPAGSAPIVP